MQGWFTVGFVPGDDTKLLLEEVSVPRFRDSRRFHDVGFGMEHGIYILYICICIQSETLFE